MKIFTIYLITALIFFFFGYYFRDFTTIAPANSNREESSLCKIDCKNLEALKHTQVNYLRTKEFMPQAIISLLATIGLKLSISNSTEIANTISNNPHEFENIIQKYSHNLKILPPLDNAEDDLTLVEPEKLMADETTLQTKVDNELLNLFNNSKYLKNLRKISKFNGKYYGYILFKKGKYKNLKHDLSLELNYFKSKKNKIDGDYFIQIIDHHGIPYSTNKGSGGNKNIKTHPDGSLIFEASPSSFLLFNNIKMFKTTKVKAKYIDNYAYVGDVYLSKE